MGAADSMLTRLQGEISERQTFIDGIVQGAEDGQRDLDSKEMELISRARTRIAELGEQADPLSETVRIAQESQARTAKIAAEVAAVRNPTRPQFSEYRSAGAYALDVWQARLGYEDATNRLDMYQRVAAHQVTSDNPGLLPESLIAPVVNFVDESRPVVSALGPRQLPGGSWSRPKVTVHTQVGLQSAQKTELPSRKMTIVKLPVTPNTYGGYVNVSRQNVDWTQPSIMDTVINDLAGQYAIETEGAACDALTAGAVDGPDIPATGATPAQVNTALWGAAALAYSACRNQGRLILAVAPNMLGVVGPLFAPVNVTNGYSSGFNAGQFGSGVMGAISGITVVMSSELAPGTMLVINTAAAEVYEDRIGALQVVEPSVLGVQVAYAGYFAILEIEPAGIIAIGTTP